MIATNIIVGGAVVTAMIVLATIGWALRMQMLVGKMVSTLEAIRGELAPQVQDHEGRITALEASRGNRAVDRVSAKDGAQSCVPFRGVLSAP
jgi:hypothetical protein